jgi:hypothetical protein
MYCVADVLEHINDTGEFVLQLNAPPTTTYKRQYTPFIDMPLTNKISYINRILTYSNYQFTLHEINFSNCSIHKKHIDDVIAIIQRFPNNIRTLDLSCNGLDDSCGESIARAIAHPMQVSKLYLHGNKFQDGTVRALYSVCEPLTVFTFHDNEAGSCSALVGRMLNITRLTLDDDADILHLLYLDSLYIRNITMTSVLQTRMIPSLKRITHKEPETEISGELLQVFQDGRNDFVECVLVLLCSELNIDLVKSLITF